MEVVLLAPRIMLVENGGGIVKQCICLKFNVTNKFLFNDMVMCLTVRILELDKLYCAQIYLFFFIMYLLYTSDKEALLNFILDPYKSDSRLSWH